MFNKTEYVDTVNVLIYVKEFFINDFFHCRFSIPTRENALLHRGKKKKKKKKIFGLGTELSVKQLEHIKTN